jgi:uncharacterized protein (DUF1810 family)
MDKPDSLQRFIDAQEPLYEEVCAELIAGRKTSHWMWFIFPQHVALGTSDRAKRYGLYGVEQAREYLAHPVLGQRLKECCTLILQHRDLSAAQIFGEVDSVKLRSSVTLFNQVDPDEPVFARVLDCFYGGRADPLTLDLVQPK